MVKAAKTTKKVVRRSQPQKKKQGGAARSSKRSTEREALDAAMSLSEVVRIQDVILADCGASLKDPEQHPLRLVMRAQASGARHPDGSRVCATVKLLLEGVAENDTVAEPILVTRAVYHAVYEIPQDQEVSPEALCAFANTNGIFNVWPYWRELVHSLTTRMGLPGLIVPTYRFGDALPTLDS